jgi:hypothetical protein
MCKSESGIPYFLSFSGTLKPKQSLFICGYILFPVFGITLRILDKYNFDTSNYL